PVARRCGPGERARITQMRTGLSCEKSVGNGYVRCLRGSALGVVERLAGRQTPRTTLPSARRRSESSELRYALRLRANQSVPNRRLDRTSLAREIFSDETKSDQREPGG